MDAFVSRKRRRVSTNELPPAQPDAGEEEDSTDLKLALLASLHPGFAQDVLLDALLLSNGSVEYASTTLHPTDGLSPCKKVAKTGGYQSSLANMINLAQSNGALSTKPLTRKGKTLHLYSPTDIETHTPCSIIHNFLPPAVADDLLGELLTEAPTFQKETFQLFDRTVESPHTMSFYVDSVEEAQAQQTEYVYNGSYIADVRKTLPQMRIVSVKVQHAVNNEVQRRITTFYPNGKKLKYQSPLEWCPNAAFVNCYDGGAESVGYHSDQLTYLGPRAIIGSLSLGVAREFRVRRIVPREADESKAGKDSAADTQGQISIHLPHNSLLVMHAEMQEEWKHAIAPAATIDPHPVAGNKRINITYRCYRDSLHPRFTPRCKCAVPCVLRCVQKSAENKGRYMWMCHAGYTPGQKGCSYFAWAEFNEDGEPPWAKMMQSGGQ